MFIGVFILVLTLFFLVLPTSYFSLYRLVLTLVSGYESWAIYDLVFNGVFWGSFVIGLMLMIAFPAMAGNRENLERLVAINCILNGFILQAFTTLWLHNYSLIKYHPATSGSGWIAFDLSLILNLGVTLVLLVTAVSLLTHRRWALRLGLSVSILLFLGLLGRLIFRYYLGPPSFTTIIFGFTSGISTYYLWKEPE
jgi:hypothetical protein